MKKPSIPPPGLWVHDKWLGYQSFTYLFNPKREKGHIESNKKTDTKKLKALYTVHTSDVVVNVVKGIQVAGGNGFDRQDWHFFCYTMSSGGTHKQWLIQQRLHYPAPGHSLDKNKSTFRETEHSLDCFQEPRNKKKMITLVNNTFSVYNTVYVEQWIHRF